MTTATMPLSASGKPSATTACPVSDAAPASPASATATASPTKKASAPVTPSVPAPASPCTAPTPPCGWPRVPELRSAGATAARYARVADEERRLGDRTVAAVARAGFPSYFVPRVHGGHQGRFAPLLPAVAGLAESCASSGWCAALWAAHGRYAALLPEQGRRELWAHSPDTRIAAGLVPHSATAVRTGSGWRVHGRWECVSTADSSQWLLLAAKVPRDSGRPDATRVFAVPCADIEVARSWNASGLRGTGSDTVTLGPTDVPAHRSFDFAEIASGRTGGEAARCYTAPALLVGGLLFCAPALGSARAALRSWTESASASAPLTGTLSGTLARTSAEIDAAELVLAAAARRADTDPVTPLAVARNHRDAVVVMDMLVTAVERLFRTGGHACDASGTVQRCWRDVHTAATHAVLRFESAADRYADALLASAPRATST